jgi:hypothetical protein
VPSLVVIVLMILAPACVRSEGCADAARAPIWRRDLSSHAKV